MEDHIFAATPPLEALRMVISNATTGRRGKVIMIAYASRADMYVRIPEDKYCYVKPCAKEKHNIDDEFMCGRLQGPCTARAARRSIGKRSIHKP